jgi:ferritin-like metal-binding protein YciE
MATKEQEILTKYLGDMHALESHIMQAIDKQVHLLDDHEDARRKTIVYRDTLADHLTALEQRLRDLGGSPTHPLKEGVAAALGVAAGLIDKVRASEAAKDLRDDYTAINHSIIAYEMLYTTAVAAGDQQTAELSKRHMKENAQFVMEINNFMPKLVLDELRQDGMSVAPDAQARAEAAVREVWNQPPHTVA